MTARPIHIIFLEITSLASIIMNHSHSLILFISQLKIFLRSLKAKQNIFFMFKLQFCHLLLTVVNTCFSSYRDKPISLDIGASDSLLIFLLLN